jgi:chromate reductase, NAD(P)H dehydrogenase (quinone)
MYGKPAASINVAAEGRGINAATQLITVLGYAGATIVEAAFTRVAVPRSALAPDGTIAPAEIRAETENALRAFVEYITATSESSPAP